MKLLDTLIENDSINVKGSAQDWKEAISVSCQPLIKSGAIMASYIDAIISSTEKNGPYYIIADGLAMPHAAPGEGVNKNCFSLVILDKPVKFEGDEREVRILMTLAAVDHEVHTATALPQVVALFENPENVIKISQMKSKEEVIDFIKSVNTDKYL